MIPRATRCTWDHRACGSAALGQFYRTRYPDARLVVITVVCEIFANDTSLQTIEATLAQYNANGELRDIDEFESHNNARKGRFLVLLDGDQVVGTGGLRPLEETIAELKRIWFLPQYRGRGWGRRMAEQLLELACSNSYTHVRLDTSANQQAAQKLYRRLGFQEIPRYNQSSCDLFMELAL